MKIPKILELKCPGCLKYEAYFEGDEIPGKVDGAYICSCGMRMHSTDLRNCCPKCGCHFAVHDGDGSCGDDMQDEFVMDQFNDDFTEVSHDV